MNISYYIPFFVVILCNIFYHIISKNMTSGFNVYFGLSITYGVAFFISFITFLITSKYHNGIEFAKFNISNVILGLVVVGIEGGYIFMYRGGWELSKGSLSVNICIAIILIFIGALVFQEGISIKRVMGFGLCFIGIILMNK